MRSAAKLGWRQVDLALLGLRSLALEIMRRKRPLTMEQVWKLHREWNIPAEVLLPPYHTVRARSRRRECRLQLSYFSLWGRQSSSTARCG